MSAIGQFTVQMDPEGSTFVVAEGESVLNAAERQGVVLDYGCRHGNCSSCKYLLLEGDCDHTGSSPYSLSETEREEGWALMCVARPVSDLVIRQDRAPDLRALPALTPKEQVARILAVEALTEGLWRLELGVEAPHQFYAGQFMEIGVPGQPGEWRAYSVSSAPSSTHALEFILKHIPGGSFSGQLTELAAGDPLVIRGPFGDGYLRAGTDGVLLVGAGSGIAPLLSILRHAAEQHDSRAFTFVYGTLTTDGLSALQPLDSLATALDLTVVPCVSEPAKGSGWEGHTGFVTTVVQRLIRDARDLDAYLCGHPNMCDAVERLLEAKGIRERRVFLDRFFSTNSQEQVALG
jgi:propane monooxygenase reductase subunit